MTCCAFAASPSNPLRKSTGRQARKTLVPGARLITPRPSSLGARYPLGEGRRPRAPGSWVVAHSPGSRHDVLPAPLRWCSHLFNSEDADAFVRRECQPGAVTVDGQPVERPRIVIQPPRLRA